MVDAICKTDDNASMTEEEAMGMLRRQIEQSVSLRGWCRRTGVSPALASSVMTGKTRVCPSVLSALGLVRVVSYQRVDGAIQ